MALCITIVACCPFPLTARLSYLSLTFDKSIIIFPYLPLSCGTFGVKFSREHRENVILVSTDRANKDFGQPCKRFGATRGADHCADLDW